MAEWKGLLSVLFLLLLAVAGVAFVSPGTPAFGQGYALTVATNSASYFGSQQVIVSGGVSPPPGSGTSVALSVYNPLGELARAASAQVDGSTGSYSYSFTAGGSDWTDGTYVIEATWSPSINGPVFHANATFYYSANRTTTTTTSTATSTGTSHTSTASSSATAPSAVTTATSTATSMTSSVTQTTQTVTNGAMKVSASGSASLSLSDSLGTLTFVLTGATSIAGMGVEFTVAVLQPATPGTTTVDLRGGTAPLAVSDLVGALDVRANTTSTGAVLFCITDPAVNFATVVFYWNGTSWVIAGQTSVSGIRVCGNLPLAALGGTPVVVGGVASVATRSLSSSSTTAASPSTSSSSASGGTGTAPAGGLPSGYEPLVAVVAAAVVFLSVGILLARRRRRWWT